LAKGPLHFGIIGCGKIFSRHAAALKECPLAELTAVSDTNAERLREIQQTHKVEYAHADFHDLLKNDDVNAVVLCTPSGLHAPMAMEALEKGKHVLSEKPLAMTIAEAKALNALAQKKGLFLSEVKQNRYTPAIEILKKAVDEGWLGKLLIGNATVRWCRDQKYYDQAPWFGTLKMDGGVVLNQAIHHIDLLRWLLGPPKSVMAKTAILNHKIEAPDTALAILQFENGALGNLELTTCAAPKNIEGSITIMGSKGTIKVGGVSLDAFEIWEVEGHEKLEIPKNAVSNHARVYQALIDAILSEKTHGALTTGENALQSLLIAEAIFLSSESHSEILIDHELANLKKC